MISRFSFHRDSDLQAELRATGDFRCTRGQAKLRPLLLHLPIHCHGEDLSRVSSPPRQGANGDGDCRLRSCRQCRRSCVPDRCEPGLCALLHGSSGREFLALRVALVMRNCRRIADGRMDDVLVLSRRGGQWNPAGKATILEGIRRVGAANRVCEIHRRCRQHWRALAEGRSPRLEVAWTCTPNESIRGSQREIIESTTGTIAIVRNEDGQLLAFLTLHDLLRAQVSMGEREGST